MRPHGMHHVTAVSAAIRENKRFYTEVLGMRLVKRSVNQDDVSAYHLFYADGAGSPGSDLTFFDWNVPRERRGGNSFVQIGLRVAGDAALAYWEQRLRENGVSVSEPERVDGRWQIAFEDPEGQRLALVDDEGNGDAPMPWDASTVPSEMQIRGLGPAIARVPSAARTEPLLDHVFGMHHDRSYERDGREVRVHAMGDAAAHSELHLLIDPTAEPARPGAGGVHHVALRVQDDDYAQWVERLQRSGVPNSGPVDRFWFQSLYMRDGNGLLFELATDGPGFAVDEDPEHLGEEVVLPPSLEPQRERILAGLTPLDGA